MTTDLTRTWHRSTPAGWSCTPACRAAGWTRTATTTAAATTEMTGPGGGDGCGCSRTSCPRGDGGCGAGAAGARGRGSTRCCGGSGAGSVGGAVGWGWAAAASDGGGGVGGDDGKARCQRKRCRHHCSPWQRPPVAAAAAPSAFPRRRHRSTGGRTRPATQSPRSRSSFTPDCTVVAWPAVASPTGQAPAPAAVVTFLCAGGYSSIPCDSAHTPPFAYRSRFFVSEWTLRRQ